MKVMFCLQGQKYRGGWEALLDSRLLLKPRMLEQIILVWKEASLLPELRYFLESVTLILESWSHPKCSLGQRGRRGKTGSFPFPLFCILYMNSFSSKFFSVHDYLSIARETWPLAITWFKRDIQDFQPTLCCHMHVFLFRYVTDRTVK